jgi:hypothetical protein
VSMDAAADQAAEGVTLICEDWLRRLARDEPVLGLVLRAGLVRAALVSHIWPPAARCCCWRLARESLAG